MQDQHDTIIASMRQKTLDHWHERERKPLYTKRIFAYAAAAILCLTVGSAFVFQQDDSIRVMSHIDTGFDYDETLGRLQYVSNILPESAMVFLSSSGEEQIFSNPVNADISHAWNPGEPWIEYTGFADVFACQSGEIMTVVKNRSEDYTVRILHDDGYESIYSGLKNVSIQENDIIQSGDQIGSADRLTAFELRKDGISVLPVFDSL